MDYLDKFPLLLTCQKMTVCMHCTPEKLNVLNHLSGFSFISKIFLLII